MGNFLATIRKQIAEFFGKMGKGQIIRLAVLLVVVIVVTIVTISLLTRVDYTALPTNGDPATMGEMHEYLQTAGVKVRSENNRIMVPSDQVDELQWQLATEGYYDEGFGFDLLQAGAGLGTTSAVTEEYMEYQRAEIISTLLEASPKIADALVVLNLAEEQVYALQEGLTESSASVSIRLTDPTTPLTAEEARALRALVRMGAGGNLKDENLSLLDTMMNNYDAAFMESQEEQTLDLNDQLAVMQRVREDLRRNVLSLLEPVFGQGRVQVAVALTLDFDDTTTQTIVFEPPVEGSETGIPVSMKSLSERYTTGLDLVQGEPGLDENGGAPSYVEDDLAEEGNLYSKTEEQVNYELNETKTLIERAGGDIENLSVSVIIPLDEEGEDWTATTADLVSTAIGAAPELVTVAAMPLPDTLSPMLDAWAESEAAAEQARLLRLILILAVIVLVIVLLIIALRIVLRAIRPPEPEVIEVESYEDVLPEASAAAQIDEEDNSPEAQILRIVNRNAEGVAQLLRNWLSEDYR